MPTPAVTETLELYIKPPPPPPPPRLLPPPPPPPTTSTSAVPVPGGVKVPEPDVNVFTRVVGALPPKLSVLPIQIGPLLSVIGFRTGMGLLIEITKLPTVLLLPHTLM
jgi:hypothetical protein